MTGPPAEARHALDELRIVGGEELVREMTATFVRFATAQVERIADASDAGALESVAAFAHALHASARQMGAAQLADAAVSAEVAANGADAAAATRAVTALRQALAAARAWLDPLAAS